MTLYPSFYIVTHILQQLSIFISWYLLLRNKQWTTQSVLCCNSLTEYFSSYSCAWSKSKEFKPRIICILKIHTCSAPIMGLFCSILIICILLKHSEGRLLPLNEKVNFLFISFRGRVGGRGGFGRHWIRFYSTF